MTLPPPDDGSIQPGQPFSGLFLRYEQTDPATGAATGFGATFQGVEFKALQYVDLVNQKLNQNIQIPLSWEHAKVIESDFPDVAVGTHTPCHMKFESLYSSKTIGLVKGGWLPSGMALQDDMIVLPDRCTISDLLGRFHNGQKKNTEDLDFADLFGDSSFRINPLLYVLEGNVMANPTSAVIEKQFLEVCSKLKIALPKASLVPEGKGGLLGVEGIIADTQPGMADKQDLLIHLAPKLRPQTSIKMIPKIWNDILEAAEKFNVQKQSLVVLAALSSVAVLNGKSPAKKLLKLTEDNYTEQLAYNALADLRSLEILMHLYAMFPKERFLLCTGDKDLALFWSGIQASNFKWHDGKLSFTVSPVNELIANATPEQIDAYYNS